MKTIILFFTFFFLSSAYAGTCTSISRVNNGANQVLTSTKYNSDLNTIYTNSNAYDGGCITDGTIEAVALNVAEFAPLYRSIKSGCKTVFSSVSTMNVEKCSAGINDAFVTTTINTSVTWGCGGCASEASGTVFYVYALDTSSGSTLNLTFSTTVPNSDGYDASNNRVLGRFFNNASSDIDQFSIDQWTENRFIPSNTDWIAYTVVTAGLGTLSEASLVWRREGSELLIRGRITTGTVTGDQVTLSLPISGLLVDASIVELQPAGVFYANKTSGTESGGNILITGGSATFSLSERRVFGSTGTTPLTTSVGTGVSDSGDALAFEARIPIEGWSGAD